MTGKTMLRKIWESHLVHAESDGRALLYVDMHLLHEVTSPQAFDGLRLGGRRVRRPDLTVGTLDHNVPTLNRAILTDPIAARQMEVMRQNCAEFGIPLHDLGSPTQGVVHVIGPELGLTLPGKLIVCGDSHTATHGAFGALAFGIGSSEVEHVLATQCLWQRPLRTMAVRVDGALPPGVTAKDLILGIIGRLGTAGATGYVVEYIGQAFTDLSMEGRMTVCNMTIEAGARAGMIAPDAKTFAYLKGRPHAPQGEAWERAVAAWSALASDSDATYDAEVRIQAADLVPMVTWGTNPGQVVPVTGRVPDPAEIADLATRKAAEAALVYMDLRPGTAITEIPIDKVFIGSCTNGRIEDLRAAAAVIQGGRVAPGVQAIVVPGSTAVKRQAEAEGLHELFLAAGFEWRESGCSMCLGMNPDRLQPGERCASTSNRNFEGRQGTGGRTHLVSPAMAAAAALHGHFVDLRPALATS